MNAEIELRFQFHNVDYYITNNFKNFVFDHLYSLENSNVECHVMNNEDLNLISNIYRGFTIDAIIN